MDLIKINSAETKSSSNESDQVIIDYDDDRPQSCDTNFKQISNQDDENSDRQQTNNEEKLDQKDIIVNQVGQKYSRQNNYMRLTVLLLTIAIIIISIFYYIQNNKLNDYFEQTSTMSSIHKASYKKWKSTNKDLEKQNSKLQEQVDQIKQKYTDAKKGVNIDPIVYRNIIKVDNQLTYQQYYDQQLELELNQIQVKCSHNSYEIGEIYRQLSYNETEPYQGGSQMLEFDILPQNNTDGLYSQEQKYIFFVEHDRPDFDKEMIQLNKWLLDVNQYHTDNPSHLPILVSLNIKEWILEDFEIDTQEFYRSLEQSILNIFSKDDIYVPKQLLVEGEQNLYDSIQSHGYPKVGDIIGKIIFIADFALSNIKSFTDYHDFIQFYKNTSLDNLMFTTLDTQVIQKGHYESIEDYYEQTENYNDILINMKLSFKKDWEEQYYTKSFDLFREAKKLNLLTRGWNLSDPLLYTFFRKSKLNFVCTDYQFDNDFALSY